MAPELDVNYFCCTLGQAELFQSNHDRPQTISKFVDYQNENFPAKPVVGFAYVTDDGGFNSQIFNNRDLYRGSNYSAKLLASSIPESLKHNQTVGLLCSSSPDFIFAWLGLMRLGYAVLLLAPQNQPPAIVHLCRSCEAEILFFDDLYVDLVKAAVAHSQSTDGHVLHAMPLSFPTNLDAFRNAWNIANAPNLETPHIPDSSIAFSFHSSGTSSGLPKPIPQSHRGVLGVLPCIDNGAGPATFTTTPLYHGGIADLFRSWTSNALIWLFPGKGLAFSKAPIPITPQNILSCLQVVKQLPDALPKIKYFSSVPYVLQTMAADREGLKCLQSMDIVGVGGAALPTQVGDHLVEQGVHLVSRFGSAECGFIASSHRHYDTDKEWQFLRIDVANRLLSFEVRDNERYELVVQPNWPHRAKTNRPDGSFMTSDLFIAHPSISNAWKYDSRADSQLTLITGKKFDPAPVEDALKAASELLDDVFVFGNGRPFPGAVLCRSEKAMKLSDEDFIRAVAPYLEKLNAESQAHSRIPRNMLIPIAFGEDRLLKSSKGTLLRNKAQERFDSAIDMAYARLESSVSENISDEDLMEAIKHNIEEVIGAKVNSKADLFSQGVDSVASMQIRYFLRRLIPNSAAELPMTVVEDCGTIVALADYVLRCRHGTLHTETQDGLQLMRQLVEDYSTFDEQLVRPGVDSSDSINAVLLTGVTGALGAHVLELCRQSTDIDRIYCLVRGTDAHAAKERVSKSLQQRGFSPLEEGERRVIVLPAKLGEASLGLSDADYQRVRSETKTIIHLAWAVNFRMKLSSFVKDHIAGIHNLIHLILQSPQAIPPHLTFCSSIASVSNYQSNSTVPESASTDPKDASPLGYSQSKWVAEQICQRASLIPKLRSRISVFRVGQLSGDSLRGIWNMKEAWPQMLSSMLATKSLPKLQSETLSWLPVDIAAKALVQGSFVDSVDDQMSVYHVLNNDTSCNWMQMLGWLHKKEEFEALDPKEWIDRLEELGSKQPDHPSLQLLGLWKQSYGHYHDGQDGSPNTRTFQTLKTEAHISAMAHEVRAVDEAYFNKLWMWIKANSSTD